MTKLITTSLYFHQNSNFFTSSPIFKKRVAKAMTEVWKPGANSKVARVLYVSNSKVWTVSH